MVLEKESVIGAGQMDNRKGNHFKSKHEKSVNASVILDKISEYYYIFKCKIIEDREQEKTKAGKKQNVTDKKKTPKTKKISIAKVKKTNKMGLTTTTTSTTTITIKLAMSRA